VINRGRLCGGAPEPAAPARSDLPRPRCRVPGRAA
jgi:hypothetical protein